MLEVIISIRGLAVHVHKFDRDRFLYSLFDYETNRGQLQVGMKVIVDHVGEVYKPQKREAVLKQVAIAKKAMEELVESQRVKK